MNAIKTENKGPKALYEVSSLAGRILQTISKKTEKKVGKNQLSSFKIRGTDYSLMPRALRATAWENKFIHSTSTNQKQRFGLMINNQRKQENNGSCMHSLI